MGARAQRGAAAGSETMEVKLLCPEVPHPKVNGTNFTVALLPHMLSLCVWLNIKSSCFWSTREEEQRQAH